MVRVTIELPYAMLTSFEVEAQSSEIGDRVRAALVAAGHGIADDIARVSDPIDLRPSENDVRSSTR